MGQIKYTTPLTIITGNQDEYNILANSLGSYLSVGVFKNSNNYMSVHNVPQDLLGVRQSSGFIDIMFLVTRAQNNAQGLDTFFMTLLTLWHISGVIMPHHVNRLSSSVIPILTDSDNNRHEQFNEWSRLTDDSTIRNIERLLESNEPIRQTIGLNTLKSFLLGGTIEVA